MNELVQGLVEKVGLDADTAKKVFEFLSDNAENIPAWLSSDTVKSAIADTLPGGLGAMFGGGE